MTDKKQLQEQAEKLEEDFDELNRQIASMPDDVAITARHFIENFGSFTDEEEFARDIISAYLKSIWHEFDPDDETTWPKESATKRWLVEIELNGETKIGIMAFNNTWNYVVRYLDPADITPKDE